MRLRLMGQEAEIPQSEAFQRQLLGREWGVERIARGRR